MADESMELPADLPLLYPESVTVNRLQILNMAGSEPTILLAFGGTLETDPDRPFEENPKGQIGIAIHPNVMSQMIPLIVQCLTWQPGQPNPGGTMMLRHLTDEEMEAKSDGIRGRSGEQGGEGRPQGASEDGAPGSSPGAGDGPVGGAGPGGGDVPGGGGAGVAGDPVAAAGRDEVAPVPEAPHVADMRDANGCIHPATMVIRDMDPVTMELKRVYCGMCGMDFE